MKILCVCGKGINRSVHIASLLKWHKHDTIAIGLENTTQDTLKMLFDWADAIILTDAMQVYQMPNGYKEKVKLWNVGPDNYPRPYNKHLMAIIGKMIEQNKDWLK